MIGRGGRAVAEADATVYSAAAREMARQNALERKRQARIWRECAKRNAKFIMPPPAVSAAARIDKTRFMGRR